MSKGIIIGAFVLLAVGAGIFVATQGDSDEATEVSPEPTLVSTATPASGETGTQPTSSEGSYVEYSSAALASAAGERVLFFHAPWCPQCRSIESGIKQDGVPDGFTVLKVDYDSNQALRQKYGVTIQTSFVKVDANGNKLEGPFVAYEDPTFSSVVNNFLN